MDNSANSQRRHPDVSRDLRALGAADLVLCLILLGRELRAARAERDDITGRKIAARMGDVERELDSRQLTIDDVLSTVTQA